MCIHTHTHIYVYTYIPNQKGGKGSCLIFKISNEWCGSMISISHVLFSCNRNLSMAASWTYDNLSFFSTTQTLHFGSEKASKGYARCWAIGSAIYIYLGICSLSRARWCEIEFYKKYFSSPLYLGL